MKQTILLLILILGCEKIEFPQQEDSQAVKELRYAVDNHKDEILEVKVAVLNEYQGGSIWYHFTRLNERDYDLGVSKSYFYITYYDTLSESRITWTQELDKLYEIEFGRAINITDFYMLRLFFKQ